VGGQSSASRPVGTVVLFAVIELRSLFFGNPFVSPGQVLLRGEVLRRIGGFAASIWRADDFDLRLRLAKEGPLYHGGLASLVSTDTLGGRGLTANLRCRRNAYKFLEQYKGSEFRTALKIRVRVATVPSRVFARVADAKLPGPRGNRSDSASTDRRAKSSRRGETREGFTGTRDGPKEVCRKMISLPKRRVLFVSHQASRTGAPILLLHFLRWLRANTSNFEIVVRLGGELSGKFSDL
jgi:hypothetical protein